MVERDGFPHIEVSGAEEHERSALLKVLTTLLQALPQKFVKGCLLLVCERPEVAPGRGDLARLAGNNTSDWGFKCAHLTCMQISVMHGF